MWDTNPWAPWGLIHATRDGRPMITETGLWFLTLRHPEAVEQDKSGALWLYLDQPYRAERVHARAFYELRADPTRRRAPTGS
ncbi:MAG TPA: hypothetical protein VMT17_19475 [Anaeromyxobacteraceae bacterium]|nr:hypothetical protein [Anaeromyxobacteraceae bacterium]